MCWFYFTSIWERAFKVQFMRVLSFNIVKGQHSHKLLLEDLPPRYTTVVSGVTKTFKRNLECDWMSLLSITFKVDHSVFLLPLQSDSSSSRFPIGARGNIRLWHVRAHHLSWIYLTKFLSKPVIYKANTGKYFIHVIDLFILLMWKCHLVLIILQLLQHPHWSL